MIIIKDNLILLGLQRIFFYDPNAKISMSSFCETHPVANLKAFLQLQFWTNFNRKGLEEACCACK